MDVLVNPHQAGTLQKRNIVQHLEGRSLTGNSAALEHVAAIGNVFQSIQVVRGRYDGLRTVSPGSQQSDNLSLAQRIQRRARLVQKEHLRIA